MPYVPENADVVYVDGARHGEELLTLLKDEKGSVLIVNGAVLPVGVFSGGAVYSADAKECCKVLKEHGVLVNQHESPFYKGDALACQRAHRNIVHSFELSRLFQAHIPTYPSGHWLFGFSSRGVHPVRDLNPDWWNSLGLETKYYNTNLHKGAFYLPNYVQKLLEKVE